MRMMHACKWLLAAVASWSVSPLALAAATTTAATVAPSTGDTLGRMVWGTVIVLLAIAAVAWFLRRVLPGQGYSKAGVIRQVGGLQLSPRERVVVLEVGGRWLVVGLHGGQMTALGEVSPSATESAVADSMQAAEPSAQAISAQAIVDPQASFAVRLQQAMQATLQDKVKSFKNKP